MFVFVGGVMESPKDINDEKYVLDCFSVEV